MNVQPWMHNRGREIKSYSPLLLNFCPCRNEMVFWRKICCFWAQEFSQAHTLQIEFYDFRQESSFLALLMMGKGQGLFFISEIGQGAFLTSKKGQGVEPSKKCKTLKLVILCHINTPFYLTILDFDYICLIVNFHIH